MATKKAQAAHKYANDSLPVPFPSFLFQHEPIAHDITNTKDRLPFPDSLMKKSCGINGLGASSSSGTIISYDRR